jgi:hypothetical protein
VRGSRAEGGQSRLFVEALPQVFEGCPNHLVVEPAVAQQLFGDLEERLLLGPGQPRRDGAPPGFAVGGAQVVRHGLARLQDCLVVDGRLVAAVALGTLHRRLLHGGTGSETGDFLFWSRYAAGRERQAVLMGFSPCTRYAEPLFLAKE